ncbi:J domain-containing protein [Cellulomonas sp. McL0617]|uniref:J domain-containing protein n=1 Tax=Cellulomonas sp. McL0617 TaxID=3415675 RepID=UPI003CEB5C65
MTHYEVLGVDPYASRRTIQAAYRRRARETHPDTGGSPAEFAAVSAAWWVLGSASRRAAYDAGLDPDAGDAWGQDVGFDAPAPPRPSSRLPDDAPSDMPEPVVDVPTQRSDAPRPPVVPPGRIDPFASPFRALPRLQDELDALPSPRRQLRFTRRIWVLVAVGVLEIGWVARFDGPHLVSPGADAAMLAFVFWIGFARKVLRLSHPGRPPLLRWFEHAFLWSGITIYLVAAVSSLHRLSGPHTLVVLGVWAFGLVLASSAEWRLARNRRRELAVRTATERHALATRWNALLRTRELAAQTRFWQATTASEPVWALRSDEDGALLGTAPEAAPQAWVDVLRSVGLDIADTSSSWAARSVRVPDRDKDPDS